MFAIRLPLLVPAALAVTLVGGAAYAAPARVTPATEQINVVAPHRAHTPRLPLTSPAEPRMGRDGLLINGLTPNLGTYG
jgi:hypothetical protein